MLPFVFRAFLKCEKKTPKTRNLKIKLLQNFAIIFTVIKLQNYMHDCTQTVAHKMVGLTNLVAPIRISMQKERLTFNLQN
jgi:hypothetical protein